MNVKQPKRLLLLLGCFALVYEKCNFQYRNVYWESQSVTPPPSSGVHRTPKTMIFFYIFPYFVKTYQNNLSDKSYIWYSLHLTKVHHIRILSNIVFFKVSVWYFEYFEFWTENEYRLFKSNWLFLFLGKIIQTFQHQNVAKNYTWENGKDQDEKK